MNFNFILTEKCNWECDYCYFSGVEEPKTVTMNQLKKHLDYIKDFIIEGYMDVQGGEIGLVPENILEYFFKTMRKQMFISTNGVFLNRKYHLNENIRPFIKMIQWHVFPNPNDDAYVENIEDPGIKIVRGIVHDNADDMIGFLNNNKHLYIDYIDFDYDLDSNVEHDKLKYFEFYRKVKHLDNVSDEAKKRILDRVRERDGLRELCTTTNDSILIDLVNEKICLCQRSMQTNVDLNIAALWKRCHTEPKDYFEDQSLNNCKSCGRLYEGKTRRLSGV